MCVCKNVALALTKMSFKVTCEKKALEKNYYNRYISS